MYGRKPKPEIILAVAEQPVIKERLVAEVLNIIIKRNFKMFTDPGYFINAEQGFTAQAPVGTVGAKPEHISKFFNQ
jgi:hypothetical protein